MRFNAETQRKTRRRRPGMRGTASTEVVVEIQQCSLNVCTATPPSWLFGERKPHKSAMATMPSENGIDGHKIGRLAMWRDGAQSL